MNSNGRPTGGYTYKDERQENAVKQSRGGQPPRKKKRRFKPNKDGMLALGALVLIAVIVIILLVLTIKAIAGAVSSGNSDETSSSADTTAEIPVVKAWHEGYIQKSISSSEISSGELILVNFENVYTQTDAIASKLTALYGTTGHNTLFVLNNADVKVRREIVSNMRDMLAALIAANPKRSAPPPIKTASSCRADIAPQTNRQSCITTRLAPRTKISSRSRATASITPDMRSTSKFSPQTPRPSTCGKTNRRGWSKTAPNTDLSSGTTAANSRKPASSTNRGITAMWVFRTPLI